MLVNIAHELSKKGTAVVAHQEKGKAAANAAQKTTLKAELAKLASAVDEVARRELSRCVTSGCSLCEEARADEGYVTIAAGVKGCAKLAEFGKT